MRATLLIAWKDLRQRTRDRSAFVIAFVVPLALAFIFSLILGGDDSITFRYAVVDQDGGTIARVFVEEVLVPLEDSGLVKLTVANSLEEGRDLAEHGSVSDGSSSISSRSSADGSSSTTIATFRIASRKRRGIVGSTCSTSCSKRLRVMVSDGPFALDATVEPCPRCGA